MPGPERTPHGEPAAGARHGLRFGLAGPVGASLLARLGAAGAAFAAHALFARFAGVEHYGTFSYVLAWLGVGVMVHGDPG